MNPVAFPLKYFPIPIPLTWRRMDNLNNLEAQTFGVPPMKFKNMICHWCVPPVSDIPKMLPYPPPQLSLGLSYIVKGALACYKIDHSTGSTIGEFPYVKGFFG